MQMRLPGVTSTLDLIHSRGQLLQKEFQESIQSSFNDKYVKGVVIGEGQHASVSICYERINKRMSDECTPLLAY